MEIKKCRDKILFFHIPKTGGQSLAKALSTAFCTNEVDILGPELTIGAEDDLLKIFQSKTFVERHTSGPVLKGVSNIDIIVAIREPWFQIVSHYLHIIREPRNILHRAAKNLSARAFFEAHSGIVGNHQSRYLVSAFFEPTQLETELLELPSLMRSALRNFRWIVPTESIDEFVDLWSLETRRVPLCRRVRANTAPVTSVQAELVELVKTMPELYSVDLLLWTYASNHFAEYREDLIETISSESASPNCGLVFSLGANRVELSAGWHPPEVVEDDRMAFWAGPKKRSRIKFCRDVEQRYLKFTALVLTGIQPENISALTSDRSSTIPISVTKIGDRFTYRVDLQNMPLVGDFWLSVPQIYSPALFDLQSSDYALKSFLATDFSLSRE